MSIMLALALAAGQASPECGDLPTQREMNACAAKQFGDADAEMNARWKEALAYMRALDRSTSNPPAAGPSNGQALLDAQRAWLAFRDAHCLTVAHYARGGSMEPMLISLCKAELTRARTAQLVELMGAM